MDGWNTRMFPFWGKGPIFRGEIVAVSFREGNGKKDGTSLDLSLKMLPGSPPDLTECFSHGQMSQGSKVKPWSHQYLDP